MIPVVKILLPDIKFIGTRRLVWGAVLAAALALPVRVAAAYLPVVGPTPIRFKIVEPLKRYNVEAAPRTAASASTLQPFNASTPRSAAAETNVPPPSLGPVITSVESPLPGELVAPFPEWESLPPGADTNLITPEMMLQFFQRRFDETGKRETTVWGPVVFTPPVPVVRPPSKATYSTP